MQKYKIVIDGNSIYFVDRAFESAYQQAMKVVNNNKGAKLYYRNTSPFGETWKLHRIY